MKSVRLDAELQARLKQAARLAGVSESDFIRAAIAEHSDSALTDTLEGRLAGIVGAVHSNGGRARRAHEKFGALIRRRVTKDQRSRR